MISIKLNNIKIEKENKSMKFKIIGIGAAGNKAALGLLENDVVNKEDILLINSTKKDIPEDYSGDCVILSPDNSGCGKERSIARQYAITAMKAGLLDKYISSDYDCVLIVTSVEGGTGSGATPIIGEYIVKVLKMNLHIVAFTGFEEDPRGMQNSIEFFQELDYENNIQTIRNSAFLKEAGNNKYKAEKLANDEFVERTKVILGKNLLASSQNIDDTDIFKIINTTGYKTIETARFDKDLIDVEDFNKICKSMIYKSKSIKSNNSSQLRLGVILNIKPESEDAIDYKYSVIKEAYGAPYEVFTHKQYDGGEQYITFISSGMKYPLDEIFAIYDRYLKATEYIEKDNNDNFFAELSKIKDIDNRFDMVQSSKKVNNHEAEREDFFSKFDPKPSKK